MPFRFATSIIKYGIAIWKYTSSAYCVNNTSASDYGKCYNLDSSSGKAVFVVTDTFLRNNVPSLCSGDTCTLPCESDGTCTRYTTTAFDRGLLIIFDGTYAGKQAMLYAFRTLTHTAAYLTNYEVLIGMFIFMLISNYIYSVPGNKRVIDFFSSGGYYDPLNNVVLRVGRYTITSGTVVDLYWSGQILTQFIQLGIYENGLNNIWYAGHATVQYAYEASPLLIMPLDYVDDYLVYPELRKAVAYAGNGVDQPGWNADDILRIVQELFPDRPWLVYDVDNATVYSNGLDIDDVAELSKYVDVLGGTYTLYVLNTNIPRKKVQDYINFYKQQNAIPQST